MGRRRSYMLAFEGIVKNLERRYRETDSSQQRERIEEYMSFRPCPECGGARLKPEVLAVTVGERNIHEFSKMSVTRAIEFLDSLELTETEQLIGARIIKEIRERLTFLDNVGVGYLQLDRAAATLSGGEAQRLRLATQIGSQLVGVLYILDEPSIGLHQRDNGKLIGTLERLRDLGNTVLVVEHDEQMMRSADHLVDMGPGAGEHGGHVVAEGTAEEVEQNKESVTGQFLSRKRVIAVPERRTEDQRLVLGARRLAAQPEGHRRRVPDRQVRRRHRRLRLGEVDARERDVFKALANRLHRVRVKPGEHDSVEGIEAFDKVIDIDQSPIGRTPRSNPATYTKLFDHIRELYSLTPGGEGARLQAGPVLVQRARRPLRDLQGRRDDQDRDALPARRVRAVRDVPRTAVQPRDARGSLQGEVDRGRARDVGRGGAPLLRQDPEAAAAAPDAARRRARLHQARPAGDDALGRRGAARQARRRSSRRSRRDGRSTSSTSRRPACTSRTSRSCSRCSSGSSTRATRCS